MAVDASERGSDLTWSGRPAANLRREQAFALAVARGLATRLALLARAASRRPLTLLPSAGGAALGAILVLAVGLVLDEPIAAAARRLPGEVVRFFADVTELGQGWVTVVPAGVAAIWLARSSLVATSRRHRARLRLLAERAFFVVAAILVPSLASAALKHLVGRVRPPHIGSPDAFAFEPLSFAASRASFPSGHATTAAALLIAIGVVAPRWRGPVALLAVVVFLSRIAIEAHYTSDVLAGALIGAVGARAVLALFARARIGFVLDGDGLPRRRDPWRFAAVLGMARPGFNDQAMGADETSMVPQDELRDEASPRPRLSVVVPMRNEAQNASPLIDEIERACAGLAPFEVICVDDGSTDATRARLAELSGARPYRRAFSHAESSGQSAAVRTGVRAARAPIVVTLDGDGQNDPAFIPKLVEALESGGPATGLVAGQRLGRKDSGFKKLQSRVANAVRAGVLKDGTRDTGCGLKAFRRDAFLALPYFDALHRFLPALMRREGYLVALVDVVDRPRRSGRSNYGLFDRLWVGILDLAGVWWLIRRRRRAPAVSDIALLSKPRKDA